MLHTWKEKRKMKCALCEIEIVGTGAAVEAGWIPYFYVNDDEYGPACSACAEMYLQEDAEGECEMKPEFITTFQVSTSSKILHIRGEK
jgi:hypothetical protein